LLVQNPSDRHFNALLPIEAVIVNALSDVLNTQAGQMVEKSIMFVAIPREPLETLNVDRIDPSME